MKNNKVLETQYNIEYMRKCFYPVMPDQSPEAKEMFSKIKNMYENESAKLSIKQELEEVLLKNGIPKKLPQCVWICLIMWQMAILFQEKRIAINRSICYNLFEIIWLLPYEI